jgi:hypothetical protein
MNPTPLVAVLNPERFNLHYTIGSIDQKCNGIDVSLKFLDNIALLVHINSFERFRI